MPLAVQVHEVAKRYRLGQLDRSSFFGDWRRKLRGASEISDPAKDFWALHGVSFSIAQGEVVGILGRNGAGKSTLLKILAQITAPTRGHLALNGRVASLLEVGTGFHPELSGRDNVFLNGTILGMTRREISAKFDEIVAFSGVEQFIDTPVKRYSSGMRVRLAFAVAAHLEAELLMIDEVLAVGDASFQQKCLGKIGEVAGSGRTVLFVSHNAATIAALCTRGIVLEKGEVAFDGTQSAALEFYSASRASETVCLRERTDREGTGELRVQSLSIRNSRGEVVAAIPSGEDAEIALHFERGGERDLARMIVRICVTTQFGTPVFTQANWLAGDWFGPLPRSGSFVCHLPKIPLPEGQYQLAFRILDELHGGRAIDSVEKAATLQITPGDFFGTGRTIAQPLGVALVAGRWRLESA